MLRILRAAPADLDFWMAPEPHGRVERRVADSAPCAPIPVVDGHRPTRTDDRSASCEPPRPRDRSRAATGRFQRRCGFERRPAEPNRFAAPDTRQGRSPRGDARIDEGQLGERRCDAGAAAISSPPPGVRVPRPDHPPVPAALGDRHPGPRAPPPPRGGPRGSASSSRRTPRSSGSAMTNATFRRRRRARPDLAWGHPETPQEVPSHEHIRTPRPATRRDRCLP